MPPAADSVREYTSPTPPVVSAPVVVVSTSGVGSVVNESSELTTEPFAFVAVALT